MTASWEFKSNDPEDLPFAKGEILTILSHDEDNWWTARNSHGQIGSIPVNYVKTVSSFFGDVIHHWLIQVDQTNRQSDIPSDAPVHQQRIIPSSNGSNSIDAQTSETNDCAATLQNLPNEPSVDGKNGWHPSVSASRDSGLAPTTPSQPSLRVKVTGTSSSIESDNKYRTPNIERKLPALARVVQPRVPSAYDKTALRLQVGAIHKSIDLTLCLKVGDIIKVTKTNINGQWEGELNGKIGHFPFIHVKFIDENGANGAEDCLSSPNEVTQHAMPCRDPVDA